MTAQHFGHNDVEIGEERRSTHFLYLSRNKLRTLWSARLPLLLFAIKSALAAGLSWEIALSLLGNEAAALAVVSAVIVVQVTSWQTVRKSIERVLGVIIGVSLAVLVAHLLGLNIWTITLIVLCAQIVGLLLQKRGQYLATQIPISAALALLLGTTASDYPFLRLLGTLIGGLVGTIISLLFSLPVYVFRARDAIITLTIELADALPKLAHALVLQQGEATSRAIYTHIRELEQQVQVTEQALSLGIDSARLNPWARRARRLLVGYPDVILTLDRLVRQMRRIAYTLNESGPSWSEIAHDQEWAHDYARLLEEIGSILVSVAEYIRSPTEAINGGLHDRKDLSIRMEHIQQRLHVLQEQMVQGASLINSAMDGVTVSDVSAGYHFAIRGSILTDIRRMLDEVQDLVTMTSGDGKNGQSK